MNTQAPPDLDVSVLIELDAAGRCAARRCAGWPGSRWRAGAFEIVGVCAGSTAPPELVRQAADWLLADPTRRARRAAPRLQPRAARWPPAASWWRCDATAEFPPGFPRLPGRQLRWRGLERAPAGGDAARRRGWPKAKAGAGHAPPRRAAGDFAGRSDMPLEDVARLLVERRAAPARLDAGGSAAAAPVLDWRDIPVFIVNRNRHEAMVRPVDEWLRAGGIRSSSPITPRPTAAAAVLRR